MRPAVVYLDYTSHGMLRRFGLLYWLRTLWSHRARLEVARHATAGQAMVLLGAVSVLAAILSSSQFIVRLMLDHLLRQAAAPVRFRADLIHGGALAARQVLRFAPIYFGSLVALATGLAGIWWLARRRLRVVAHRLGAIAAASVPVLWFFILFQFEGLAPFLGDPESWHGPWNPITNAVRFALLMGGLLLAVIWVVDLGRIYHAVRE